MSSLPPLPPELPLGADAADADLPGTRLWRMEVCNWGTFHRKVWSLDLRGRWSLLVGENGSGKSTAVDALRTLLVRPRGLHYNDAAGGRAKQDRTRESYIRGAWAANSVEDSHVAQTEYLRPPGEVSRLLAVFRAPRLHRTITLAQVLWIDGDGKPDEFFLVAIGERTIQAHLDPLDGGKREKKTRLEELGWRVFTTFSSYSEYFRPLLGLPGESALEVFNQAIGVKEIEDANRFVRRHLLEPQEPLKFIEETVTPLHDKLHACWESIKRVERQIGLLGPVRVHSTTAEEARLREKSAQELLGQIDRYFASHEVALRDMEAKRLDDAIGQIDGRIDRHRARETALDNERGELQQQLGRGDAAGRIQALAAQVTEWESKRTARLKVATQIELCLRRLGGSRTLTGEADWTHLRADLTQKHAHLTATLPSQRQSLHALELDGERLDQEQTALATRLAALDRNQVNLDQDYLDLRALIAREAKVPVADLPFGGELVEVAERHAEWTGAIDRLMRGFGLSLLVPEAHYAVVTPIINRRHLGLRLAYFRVPEGRFQPPSKSPGERRVCDRLVFRTEHPLHAWAAVETARAFSHLCCADETELGREPLGLTKEGLIRNGSRHVKDDSRHIGDASNHVLGWSTAKKRQALVQRAAELTTRRASLATELATAQKAVATADAQLAAIAEVLAVETFASLDVAEADAKLVALRAQIEEIERTDEARQTLKKQIKGLDDQLRELRSLIETANGERGGLDRDRIENARLIAVARGEAGAARVDTWGELEARFAALREPGELDLKSFPTTRTRSRRRLDNQRDQAAKDRGAAEQELVRVQLGFLNEYPEFRGKLDDKVASAPEFVALLAKLEGEELGRHRDEFERIFNLELVGNMAMFNTRLQEQFESAKERIGVINRTLKGIPYAADSYLQVEQVEVRGGEIAPFKAQLKACISGGTRAGPDERLLIFERISALLREFRAKPEWARQVTDVRNWLEFGFRERWRATDAHKDYLPATSGKSGGQKALLAFAVLASAILAQYGLTDEATAPQAFRLVVIDEVFSRTDEENSRRALELFKQLGLQLLVVSPFDAKARLVEDHVDSFHLALNPERNASSLQRATRERYEQAFAGSASAT